MLTPEDLAHFEESRSRAYALLAEAAAELDSGSRAGSDPGAAFAAAARAEALRHIAAAQDALDRMSG
jgi:hypothetical protein